MVKNDREREDRASAFDCKAIRKRWDFCQEESRSPPCDSIRAPGCISAGSILYRHYSVRVPSVASLGNEKVARPDKAVGSCTVSRRDKSDRKTLKTLTCVHV